MRTSAILIGSGKFPRPSKNPKQIKQMKKRNFISNAENLSDPKVFLNHFRQVSFLQMRHTGLKTPSTTGEQATGEADTRVVDVRTANHAATQMMTTQKAKKRERWRGEGRGGAKQGVRIIITFIILLLLFYYTRYIIRQSVRSGPGGCRSRPGQSRRLSVLDRSRPVWTGLAATLFLFAVPFLPPCPCPIPALCLEQPGAGMVSGSRDGRWEWGWQAGAGMAGGSRDGRQERGCRVGAETAGRSGDGRIPKKLKLKFICHSNLYGFGSAGLVRFELGTGSVRTEAGRFGSRVGPKCPEPNQTEPSATLWH